MTRQVVIRIDNETRLRLGGGDRMAVSVEAGAHRIEAALRREIPCVVDVTVGAHDEIIFACCVTRFFRPKLFLEPSGRTTVRERFHLDREEAREERFDDPESIDMWSCVLGVRADATDQEIRHAYVEQMRLYHPDRTLNLSENMREIAAGKAREINIAYAAARRYLRGG